MSIRRRIAALVLAGAILGPTPGCAGPAAGLGPLLQLALGVGGSVGSFFLIQELTD